MSNQQVKKAYWVTTAQGNSVYAVAHARATVRGNSTVDADLTRLEERMASSGSFTLTTAAVSPGAWQDDAEGVYAALPVAGVTAATLALVFSSSDDEAIHRCGLKAECMTENGTVTVYARAAPEDVIRFTILALYAQGLEQDAEVFDPNAPAIAYYKMPVASKDTLGGVKIGDNIEVAEDGTISAKGVSGCNHVLSGGAVDSSHHVHTDDCIRDLVADPEDVMDALHRALGIDTDPEDAPENQGADPDVSQD